MSNTHNTTIRRQRTKLMAAGNRMLRQRGMGVAQPLFEAAYKLVPVVRHGNLRKSAAALKVKLRRLARRQAQRGARQGVQEYFAERDRDEGLLGGLAQ